jgi:hypothetical protein
MLIPFVDEAQVVCVAHSETVFQPVPVATLPKVRLFQIEEINLRSFSNEPVPDIILGVISPEQVLVVTA